MFSEWRCVLGVDPGLASFGWVIVELHASEMITDLTGRKARERVIAAGTIETKKSDKKSTRKSDDQLRRIQELADALADVVTHGGVAAVDAIAAESQSWPHPPQMDTTALYNADIGRERFICAAKELIADSAAGTLQTNDLRRRLGELTPKANALSGVDAHLQRHERATYGLLGSSTMIAMSWGVLGCLSTLLSIPVYQVSPQKMRIELLGSRGGKKERIQAALIDRYGEPALEPIMRMTKKRREHAFDALGAVVATLGGPLERHRPDPSIEEDIPF